MSLPTHTALMKGGYLYIMTNGPSGPLYIGVTANLAARVAQHRSGSGSDFCHRYGLVRLVYIERHDRIDDAIARESAQGLEARSYRQSQSRLGRPLLDGQRLRREAWMPACVGMMRGEVAPQLALFAIRLDAERRACALVRGAGRVEAGGRR